MIFVAKITFLPYFGIHHYREELCIDFEPCDGDNITTVSTDHNADLALVHDIAKWLSCFSKECRNINRLTNQLVKCQNLQASGHKNVEVRGVGQVNLEVQIDEVKQQIRKCLLSKHKAYARLMAIKESGLQVENLDELEARIKTEMKTVSLDVDTSNQPLSRTPSMKSSNVSDRDDGRASGMDKSYSEDDNHTPEPDQYVRDTYDQEDSDRETPAPSYNTASNQGGWAEEGWGNDPSQAWGNEPAVPAPRLPEPIKESVPEVTYQPAAETYAETYDNQQEPQQEWSQDQAFPEESATQEYEDRFEAPAADGTQMDGKICRALYAYQAQNSDELDLTEEEVVTIIAATDVDWVTAQNSAGQTGFIPAAYLEIIGDAPPAAEFDEVSTNETAYEAEPVPEPETTQVVST